MLVLYFSIRFYYIEKYSTIIYMAFYDDFDYDLLNKDNFQQGGDKFTQKKISLPFRK